MSNARRVRLVQDLSWWREVPGSDPTDIVPREPIRMEKKFGSCVDFRSLPKWVRESPEGEVWVDGNESFSTWCRGRVRLRQSVADVGGRLLMVDTIVPIDSIPPQHRDKAGIVFDEDLFRSCFDWNGRTESWLRDPANMKEI
jgi:hypothetical protein